MKMEKPSITESQTDQAFGAALGIETIRDEVCALYSAALARLFGRQMDWLGGEGRRQLRSHPSGPTLSLAGLARLLVYDGPR
jgi:hypothetical protein